MNPALIGFIVVILAVLIGVGIAAKGDLLKSINLPSTPPLDITHPLIIELSEELRALDALPIATKNDRVEWDKARSAFDVKLRTSWQSIYEMLPHELEHYLSDVDIRAKDLGYAQHQRSQLAELLTLSPHPRPSAPSAEK